MLTLTHAVAGVVDDRAIRLLIGSGVRPLIASTGLLRIIRPVAVATIAVIAAPVVARTAQLVVEVFRLAVERLLLLLLRLNLLLRLLRPLRLVILRLLWLLRAVASVVAGRLTLLFPLLGIVLRSFVEAKLLRRLLALLALLVLLPILALALLLAPAVILRPLLLLALALPLLTVLLPAILAAAVTSIAALAATIASAIALAGALRVFVLAIVVARRALIVGASERRCCGSYCQQRSRRHDRVSGRFHAVPSDNCSVPGWRCESIFVLGVLLSWKSGECRIRTRTKITLPA